MDIGQDILIAGTGSWDVVVVVWSLLRIKERKFSKPQRSANVAIYLMPIFFHMYSEDSLRGLLSFREVKLRSECHESPRGETHFQSCRVARIAVETVEEVAGKQNKRVIKE
jgi:hypothetical protein